jgi:methylthioribose-1-phosphate isomerase
MPRTPADTVKPLKSIAWDGGLENGRLVILDQTRLPGTVRYLPLRDLESVRQAIAEMSVRGAPAIGIAGAYGLVLHLVPRASAAAGKNSAVLAKHIDQAITRLVGARPTAVNLSWALERQRQCFKRHIGHLTALEMCARLLMEAKRIHREDEELCARIADHGAPLLTGNVLTICNTGALATGGVGTALGCIVRAHQLGRKLRTFACESRPLLQGSRLTAPELQRSGVPVTVICDTMAGALMATGQVKAVIVGADRIAANGDTANKIGTYQLAVLAKGHRIPFYVAAPYSTFDLKLKDGMRIPIEERDGDEVRRPRGVLFAPADVEVWNPAFDITPAELITAIITDRGVVRAPTVSKIRTLLA